jgi:hypothetical protein
MPTLERVWSVAAARTVPAPLRPVRGRDPHEQGQFRRDLSSWVRY